MASNQEPVIRLSDVGKSFTSWQDRPDSVKKILVQLARGRVDAGQRRRSEILKNISFDIFPGEFVGIMGRNGAGKSTIMKMIAGIYTPNEGKISIRGTVAPLLELGAGFAFDLSGYENIFLNASILGYSNRTTKERLNAIIDFSELNESIYMPVKRYSSGMLVRLGFSIATHLDASILLFDEVLAVGDVGFQAKCLDKIHELHQNGRAIVLITHSPEQVVKYCDRCIVVENHGIIYDGPAAEGADAYRSLFQVPLI